MKWCWRKRAAVSGVQLCMTKAHCPSHQYPKPFYTAPKGRSNGCWVPSHRVNSPRTGVCWLNPQGTNKTNYPQLPLLRLWVSSSQAAPCLWGVSEGLSAAPAGVGRVLRVGGAAPRRVGGSLGGLRGELAKGRRGVLSAAGEACVLGAGGAVARSAHHSRACREGSCV